MRKSWRSSGEEKVLLRRIILGETGPQRRALISYTLWYVSRDHQLVINTAYQQYKTGTEYLSPHLISQYVTQAPPRITSPLARLFSPC